MDNQEIIDQMDAAKVKVAAAKRARALAIAEVEFVRSQCKHPNARLVTHMGESCTHCYDCGNCP